MINPRLLMLQGKKLNITYASRPRSPNLWKLDIGRRTLQINVDHPFFVACEGAERKMDQFSEMIAAVVLAAQAYPRHQREELQDFAESVLERVAALINTSASFTKRRAVRA